MVSRAGASELKLIGLRSSPERVEWLGKARVQMRCNGQASNSRLNLDNQSLLIVPEVIRSEAILV